MQFLQKLTPASLVSLNPFSSTLSVLLSKEGGILDDLIITKHSDTSFYVVTNAGRCNEDLAWFESELGEWNAAHAGQETHHRILDQGLIALQGASNVDSF